MAGWVGRGWGLAPGREGVRAVVAEGVGGGGASASDSCGVVLVAVVPVVRDYDDGDPISISPIRLVFWDFSVYVNYNREA